MDYKKIYGQLVTRGQTRQQGKNRKILKNEIGLVERHHIVPKCLGGTDEKINLVFFTPEEHVVAHLLLVKIYNKPELIYAANWMTSRVKNNKEYGWIKREFVRAESLLKTGKSRSKESVDKQTETILKKYKNGYTSPRLGTNLSDDHKEAISTGNKGKIIKPESRSSLDGYVIRYGIMEGTKKYNIDKKKKDNKSIESLIRQFGEIDGPIKYKEYCNTMSDKRSGKNNYFYGKKHTEESKNKISTSNTGKSKIRTDEHNNKIGAANKGRTHTKIICPHCNKEGGCTTMNRWHFDNCKTRPGGPLNERKIQPTVQCPHCNKVGSGPRMKSNHFDNCKSI